MIEQKSIGILIDCPGSDNFFDLGFQDRLRRFWLSAIDTTEHPTKSALSRKYGIPPGRVARILRALDLEEYRAQAYVRQRKEKSDG